MRQIGTYELVTAPAAEPLTTTEAKAFCRVEHSTEDALFTSLIAAARSFVERDAGLALVSQGWQVLFDRWDERGLRLRPHPFADLDSVEVWDGTAFVAQDLAGFQVVSGRPALLLPVDAIAPATPMRARQGIRIGYTAGFGEAATDVPDDILTAMKQLVAHWYEQREPTAVTQSLSVVGDVKFTVASLLSQYRTVRLA
jgi:uncharacterized phiE125 gp8 family phage protein